MRYSTRRLLQSALNQYGEEDENSDQKSYKCDRTALSPELAACFVELQCDQDTEEFLEHSRKQSSNVCLQLFYTFVHILLGIILTTTAINGLLERGKMFVFSCNQLAKLLRPLSPHSTSHSVVLDIGSGDGHVTDKIKAVLKVPTIHVTETCRTMTKVLRKKGYIVEDPHSWHSAGCKYDFISCLNVLDRCSHPLSMLRHISNNLQPGGVLMLALVLPYKPFVEKALFQAAPSELLPLACDATWEEGVSVLWNEVLLPLGYAPLAVSRLPYLCEGDLHSDFYALDDVILVLRKT